MFELELFEIYNLKEMSLSTEIFLSCSILQLTFYAIATSHQRKHGFVILTQQVYFVGVLIVGLAFFILINEDLMMLNSLSGNNFIINDYLGFASKSVICFVSFLFLIMITVSYEDRTIQNNFEYTVLILISILGLLLLCSSNDLITSYLAIELQSVAFYLMAAFKKNSTYSIESGLKYFIIGSLSSAFFLFGSALIYGCLGTLSFDDIRMFLSLASLDSTSSLSESTTGFLTDSLTILSPISLLIYSVCLNEKLVEATTDLSQINLTNYDDLVNYVADSSTNNVVVNSEPFFNISLKSSDFIASYLNGSFSLYENLNYGVENTKLMDSLMNMDTGIASQQIVHSISDSCINSLSTGLQLVDISKFNLDLVYLGFIFLCVSLFIKLALAPFHLWSLDVYEGSPNTTTAFFAVVPKLALFVLLLRICYSSFYYSFSENWQSYFLMVSVFSIFIGSIGGLEQRKIKSLLAYSSISHTGYLLLSLSTNSVEGMSMMLYYLVIFMVSSLCFWSVYLFIHHKKNAFFKKRNKELGDLALMRESNPLLALILAMTLFSIAGIPPIVGFLAKIGIFLVVIKSSAYLVSLFAILFSVASTFYYIRVIKILYFENILVGKLYMPIATKKALIIAILALSLIVLCIDPSIIYFMFHISSLLSSY